MNRSIYKSCNRNGKSQQFQCFYQSFFPAFLKKSSILTTYNQKMTYIYANHHKYIISE